MWLPVPEFPWTRFWWRRPSIGLNLGSMCWVHPTVQRDFLLSRSIEEQGRKFWIYFIILRIDLFGGKCYSGEMGLSRAGIGLDITSGPNVGHICQFWSRLVHWKPPKIQIWFLAPKFRNRVLAPKFEFWKWRPILWPNHPAKIQKGPFSNLVPRSGPDSTSSQVAWDGLSHQRLIFRQSISGPRLLETIVIVMSIMWKLA